MSLSPEKQFLRELTKLSKKYGFTIGACGCCDSPWISGSGVWLDSIEFKDGRYSATDESGKVVR